MGLPLVVNGSSFLYPETGDKNWGSQATLWSQAVTVGMLQRAGGAFTLTADVDFGASFGLLAMKFSSRDIAAAASGLIRLSKTDTVSWRNNANGADLALGINGSDQLTFSGNVVRTGLIVNADVSAAAAIALSKLAALSTSVAAVTDGSGVLTTSPTTATQIGYLSTSTSDIQTQLNAKAALAGATFTGPVLLSEDPVSSNEAATKSYVDSIATGLNAKTAVRVATTANGTLASAFANGQTVDGVSLSTGNRILIKNQTSASENGIYTVNASGAPTRATDADSWAELVGAFVFVSAGTANTATSWVCNVAAGGTIGVTAITFVQFSASQAYTASGQGIVLSGSEFDLQLDGTTLSQSGSGVKVNQIANAQIAAAAAIAVNKLAALTASKVTITDGSGFLSTSTVTPTTLAFLDATSSVQTQLDAKIAKSVLTTTNDMIYATSANTPARLAAGTDGYHLVSASGVPTWTNPKTSYSEMHSAVASYSIGTTWTALTLVSLSNSVGTAVTISTNDIIFPFTGIWEIELYLSNVSVGSTDRTVFMTVFNSTGSTILGSGRNSFVANSGATSAMVFKTAVSISSTTDHYQVQLAASGGGATVNTAAAINGRTPNLYVLTLRYINI